MELIISKCKECGHKVHSFTALDQSMLCPKCGKKTLEQTGKTSTDFNPEFTVPAAIDKKAFLTLALEQMKTLNVPIELYKSIDPNRITRYFIPAFGYSGSIDAKWECEYDGTTEITVNNKTKNIIPGTPLKGEVSGCDFDAFLPGAESGPNEGNEWVKNFAYPIPAGKAMNINPAIFNETKILTFLPSSDSLKVWSDKGQDLSNYVAQQHAESYISNSFGLWEALGLISKADAAMMSSSMGNLMGNNIPPTRNWKIFSRSNLVQKPKDALIPVWYLPIEFKGKNYFFAATADETHGATYSLPTAEVADNTCDNEEIKEAEKKAKYIKLAGFIAIPLFFIAGLIATLIFLAAWFVAFKYFGKQVDSLKKAESDKNSNEVNEEIRKVQSKLK